MKKILFTILILSCIPVHAISIKEKIKNLRKALAVHAKSENRSWKLLEELDKRVDRLEDEFTPCHHHEVNDFDLSENNMQKMAHTERPRTQQRRAFVTCKPSTKSSIAPSDNQNSSESMMYIPVEIQEAISSIQSFFSNLCNSATGICQKSNECKFCTTYPFEYSDAQEQKKHKQSKRNKKHKRCCSNMPNV